MTFHRFGLSRYTLFNLRGGFLLRPMALVGLLGASGAVLSWAEGHHPTLGDWLPAVLFPSRHDPQVAQILLSTIASSIMTVVSIVFAVLLMTLTLASMQFSPRIIVNFIKDKVTQITLGLYLGTFAYCVAALPAAYTLPKPGCTGADRVWGDVAGLVLRWVAAVLHSSHLSSHQRQPYR